MSPLPGTGSSPRRAPGTSATAPGRVETLDELPGLGGLYVRGAASSGRIAAARALPGGLGRRGETVLPAVTYRVPGVETGPDVAAHLERYQRLLGERVVESLPAGFLHVLAFPLATALMVRPDFPLPLLGMVHLANSVSLVRPVRLGDTLEVQAWSENLRPHRRGAQVDLVTEVWSAGPGQSVPELAYRGVSTYLAKGITLPEGPETAPHAEPGGPGEEWAPPLPTGRWALGARTGSEYAAVSGDRNPIHTSKLGAKAFGFPRAIAHGMYTAARALAEVGPARGETYDWTVTFAKPVLLPSTVNVAIRRTADSPEPAVALAREVAPAVPDGAGDLADGFAYQGWNSKGRLHLAGAVTPR